MTKLDDTPTEQLLQHAATVAAKDATREADERWALVWALHSRGEESVFQAAEAWCADASPLLRCLGADVLGQLGYDDDHPFDARSLPALVRQLDDPEAVVVSCALVAMGHLRIGDPDAVCALARHESAEVRHSVAYCLGGRDDELSLTTLVGLSKDPDGEVRDGATFALGELSEHDSPMVREALALRLGDEDEVVRLEAMRGLASRGDARAIPVILACLENDSVDSLAVEAAAEFPDARFVKPLELLLGANPGDEDIKTALECCQALGASPGSRTQ